MKNQAQELQLSNAASAAESLYRTLVAAGEPALAMKVSALRNSIETIITRSRVEHEYQR